MTNTRNTVLYIGVTNDLVRRVYEHKHHLDKSSFTSKYNVGNLVYFEITTDIESAFCHNCGGKLVEANVNSNSGVTVVESVEQLVAMVDNTKKCSKCGFTTDDPELLFCTECGTKF